MKVITQNKGSFTYRGKEHVWYTGRAYTTKECELTTGYRGHGLPSLMITIPANTEVGYTIKKIGGNWQVTIKYAKDGINYDTTSPINK